MSVASTILVADVGGTNARFALTHGTLGQPPLDAMQQVATSAYASLGDALAQYIGAAAGKADRAVLAVASAVTSDAIKFTNSPWSFSVRELSARLGLPVTVINDFTAMASVLPALQPQDLHSIGQLPAISRDAGAPCTYAVVGPGTGLGVGGVMLRGGHPTVIQSEGGHVGFAPGTLFEIELLRVLMQRHERVSAERLISGSGLVPLHEAICIVEGKPVEATEPRFITERAAAEPDGVCARTLEVFVELLGSFAGDIALAFGAWDGVFLPGGVTQKLLPWIEAGGFRRRFENKGRHSAILQRIPTDVITHPQAGLLGTAVYALANP